MSTPWLFWYTLLVLGAGCCMGYRWRRTDYKARVDALERDLAAQGAHICHLEDARS